MICSLFQIVQFGVLGGIAMNVTASALNLIGFTKLNLNTYTSCLITGQKLGIIPFIANCIARLAVCVINAYIYIQAIAFFNLAITMQTALIMGTANTIFSGFLSKITDTINPCVASRQIRAINFFAIGYGASGVATYFLSHYAYAIVFFALLGAPLSL